MRASHKPSREDGRAEARRPIKVPLFFHVDKHETQFWKGCPANQTVILVAEGDPAMDLHGTLGASN
jgi:hypothetical protein